MGTTSSRSLADDPVPLADYEAACKADPDVKRFDDKLHSRTKEALSSLATGGVSLNSLKDFTTKLLEVDDEVVRAILQYKEDVWANKELKDLVTAYLDTSQEALDFCMVLEKCLQQTRDNLERHIEVAIKDMPADGEPTEEQCDTVLKELQEFVQAEKPLPEDFHKQLMKVYEHHLAMQQKLPLEKKKLDSKMRKVRGWMKVSNIIYGATCASVLLCKVMAAAIGAPKVAEDLAEESKKPKISGSWLRPLCRRYELIKTQQAIVEAASLGTFVAIEDLKNMEVSITKLQNEIGDVVRNIEFGEHNKHDNFALEVAMEPIKRKQRAITKTLEDLRETVSQSRHRINKARMVFESILILN